MFDTTATMKEHDAKSWWIDRNIIRTKYIKAGSIKEALQEYATLAEKNDYISISPNAIKNKSAMYIDGKDGASKQIGYVITGKTSFDNDRGRWIDKYIDLWIEISVVDTPNFDEE